MSDYKIYIEVEDYLRQWLMHKYGEKGMVVFPKYSIESYIVKNGLKKPPKDYQPPKPKKTAVPVYIPYSKKINIRYNFYFPLKEKRKLIACIKKSFKIALWEDLNDDKNIGKKNKTIIYEWMMANGIENSEKNWNTIAKIFSRQKKLQKKNQPLSRVNFALNRS